MPDIDRSRTGMKRRIAELNRRHCNSASDLQNTLNELVRLNVQDLRESVAAAVIECMNRFAVAGTPVDTGGARAGWHITGEQSETGFMPAEGLSKEEYRRMTADNAGRLNLSNYERIFVIS